MPTASDFFVATVDERLGLISDQIVAGNEYFAWLKEKGRVKFKCGGDGFSFSVRKSASGLVHAVGDWSLGQAKTAATSQKISADYRAYAGELMQSRFQLKRNEYAGVTGKVFDLWEEALNELTQDFENTLGADIYADGAQAGDDEATPIEGLASIVDTDNTHFSIVRGTDTWWQAFERTVSNNFLDDDDADGVINGIVAMRLAFLDACKGAAINEQNVPKTIMQRKNRPDAIFTTLNGYNNYCLALQPQQQYVGGAKNDAGQEVAFWGVPVKWDTYCTTDRMYIVSSKYLHVRVVGESLVYRDIEQQLGASGEPRAKAIGLAAQCQHFSTNPRMHATVANVD